VTLIAGFKCDEGFVICADTQEIVKRGKVDHRTTRQKLVPVKVGTFSAAIAGAGSGNLIDAFVSRLEGTFDGSELTELIHLKELLKDDVLAFAEEQQVPISEIDDNLRFMIGVHSPESNKCALWETSAGYPIEVNTFALVGYEDERYKYAAQNFYRPNMPTSQAVCLGLYIMWLAEQTSPYVKAPITVVILKNGGINFVDPTKIGFLDHKVRVFTAEFEAQFMACADTSLQGTEFSERLTEFAKTIIQFRRDYIEEWVGHLLDQGLDKTVESFKGAVPLGTTIVVAPTPHQAQLHQEMQTNLQTSLRENFGYVQEPDRIMENLRAVALCQRKLLAQYSNEGVVPTEEELVGQGKALGEIMQAAMMGPHKVNLDVCILLDRVSQALRATKGDMIGHDNIPLRDSTNLLRVGVVEQTIAILESSPFHFISPSGNEPPTQ